MIEKSERLHALDAVRGFALLLGVAYHASLSFLPGWAPGTWATSDVSTSQTLGSVAFVAHIFRMPLFFFIAGYFARLLHQKLGARGFWINRGQRILIPLVVGWVVLYPMLALVWRIGLARMPGGATPPMPEMIPKATAAFPLTHLWFLYQLLLIYVGFLAFRAIVMRTQTGEKLVAAIDASLTFGIRSGLALFTLGLPLAAALIRTPVWFYWTGIPTPDHSLLPTLSALAGFGTAFIVGWFVHRSPDALGVLTQRWPVNLTIAVAATAPLLYVVNHQAQAHPGPLTDAFAYLFGVAVWGWVFGLTGVALRFLSGYSATRRYIADSSYWIYLVHLPLVTALQVCVARWPLGWTIKFPLVLVVSFAVLFASYQVLVRPTVIGQILNGRRVKGGSINTPMRQAG